MAIQRRQSTQTEYARLTEEYQKAIDKVQEYLAYVSRTVEMKNQTIAALESEISNLIGQKSGLESHIKAKEEEFRLANEEKSRKILSEASENAKKQSDLLLGKAKAEVSNLTTQRNDLEKSIKGLSESYTKNLASLESLNKDLEAKKKGLESDVAKLAFARDELQKQIQNIREKLTSLTV